MYKLGINFDEVSSDIKVALDFMSEHQIKFGELRMVNNKNFVFWDDKEVQSFKGLIAKNNIELVAAATPLFKWYVNGNDEEVLHDSFGFNARLDESKKKHIILQTINIANQLNIKRLRIFSGLGRSSNAGELFARDPLLSYALELADKADIDLYIENEPVCRVHNKKQLSELFKSINHPRLKFWLDIANLVELNEDIDETFMQELAPRLGYLHIKDYILKEGHKEYVPAGEGIIDYLSIFKTIFDNCNNELAITIETHAKSNKIEMSSRAIAGTRLLLIQQGIEI